MSLVVAQQDAIEVYLNADGAIVIRQSAAYGEGLFEEAFVIVQPEQAGRLCAGIMECVELPHVDRAPEVRPERKDATGAERQRRYRARLRERQI
ncbi:MAG TPA: hypothetical protein VG841_08720 [Caulobacterales bacterium]|nr:hypothetical protein [Caulobacterales bacterium]